LRLTKSYIEFFCILKVNCDKGLKIAKKYFHVRFQCSQRALLIYWIRSFIDSFRITSLKLKWSLYISPLLQKSWFLESFWLHQIFTYLIIKDSHTFSYPIINYQIFSNLFIYKISISHSFSYLIINFHTPYYNLSYFFRHFHIFKF